MRKRMVDSVDKKRKKTNTCDQVSHEGSNENQQSKKRRYERVSWQFRYDQLVEFRNQFGHTNVPQNYAKNMKLAAWVKFQRSQYKTGNLIKERINQLNELSFEWYRNNKKQASACLASLNEAAEKKRNEIAARKERNREAAEKKKNEIAARKAAREELKQKRIANKKPIVNETQSQHFEKVEEIEVRVNTICCRCLSSY